MRSRRPGVLLLGFLIFSTGTALAQDKPEVSAGWRDLYIAGSDDEVQGLDVPDAGDGMNIPKGWYFDVAVPFSPMLSIVGDIGGHYKSETAAESVQGVTVTGTAEAKVHTFMGGIRLRGGQNQRVSPFAQVLFGAARGSFDAEGSVSVGGTPFAFDFSESETEAALSLGGGVNLSAGSLGVRLQAEWLKILADDSGNAFRFGVGVVIPF